MIQSSRLPAVLILAGVLACGGLFMAVRQSDAAAAGASHLPELQAAVARPGATAKEWLAYAKTLQELKRFADATWAFEQTLRLDPLIPEARLQGAICYAQKGNADEFFTFMQATKVAKPTLARDIFLRPEVQRYLAEPRFQALQKEAIAASMD